jgi:hypothetical protein
MIYKISSLPSLLKRGRRKGRNAPRDYAKTFLFDTSRKFPYILAKWLINIKIRLV